MPPLRLFGNAVLSLMTKLSSGYWDLFDPTNGYTAIHADVARFLPFDKISRRYFFETDMLFRLNTLRAVVVDVPMDARLRRRGQQPEGLADRHRVRWPSTLRNFVKRLFYNYYLRNMSLASIELPLGVLLVAFGIVYGGAHWLESARQGVATPAGTVMLAALPVIMGLQLILAFLAYDIASVPRRPLHKQDTVLATRDGRLLAHWRQFAVFVAGGLLSRGLDVGLMQLLITAGLHYPAPPPPALARACWSITRSTAGSPSRARPRLDFAAICAWSASTTC